MFSESFFINSLRGFFQHKFTTLLNKVLSNSLHQSCKYFYKTLVNIWNLFIIILIYISTTVLLGHKHSFFIVAGNFYGIFKKTSTEFLHNRTEYLRSCDNWYNNQNEKEYKYYLLKKKKFSTKI